MEARKVRLPGCSGEAGLRCGKQNSFPWLCQGVLVLLATRDGQFESFKWAAIELLRFAASLVGPDHGVVTVLLVSFDTVGTIPTACHPTVLKINFIPLSTFPVPLSVAFFRRFGQQSVTLRLTG